MRIDRVRMMGMALSALLAFGATAHAEDLKIGIVDVEQAVTSTDTGKAARQELESKIKEAEAQLQPMMDRYQAMVKEIEAKQFVLSEDAMRQKRLEVAELQNKIVNRRREIQGQLEVERERLIGPIREKFAAIIADVGRKEGFALILQRGAPGLMYSREALDITDLVVEEFNK